ncbi:hypothetical protein JT358_09900 [Micrococcales bacterium 31B]|nr:hypothetical protein [Micrococcales bacterium 31B]
MNESRDEQRHGRRARHAANETEETRVVPAVHDSLEGTQLLPVVSQDGAGDGASDAGAGDAGAGDETRVLPAVGASDATQVLPAVPAASPTPRKVQSNPFPAENLPTAAEPYAEPPRAHHAEQFREPEVEPLPYVGAPSEVADPPRRRWPVVLIAVAAAAVLIAGGILIGQYLQSNSSTQAGGGATTSTAPTSEAAGPAAQPSTSESTAETSAAPSGETSTSASSDASSDASTDASTSASATTTGTTPTDAASDTATRVEGAPSNPPTTAAPSAGVPATSSFGDQVTWEDGVAATVAAPATFTPSDTATFSGELHEGQAVAIAVTLTNGTDTALDVADIPVVVTLNGAPATLVEDSANRTVARPSGTLAAGESLTYRLGVAASPGTLSVIVTNAAQQGGTQESTTYSTTL